MSRSAIITSGNVGQGQLTAWPEIEGEIPLCWKKVASAGRHAAASGFVYLGRKRTMTNDKIMVTSREAYGSTIVTTFGEPVSQPKLL